MESSRLIGRLTLIAVILAATGLCAAVPQDHVSLVSATVNSSALHPGQHATLTLTFKVGADYHARSHDESNGNVAFKAKFDPAPELKIGEMAYPPGKDENSPALGQVNVYRGTVVVRVPIDVDPNAKTGPLKIDGNVRFQACSDSKNICYNPESAKFTLDTAVVPADQNVTATDTEILPGGTPQSANAASSEGSIASADSSTIPAAPAADVKPFLLASLYNAAELKKVIFDASHHGSATKLAGSDWSMSYAFGAAFLAGLLFNIMPCVLPVLPLKAIGFYEVGQHKRSASFFFGLVFSFGIISVFAILAVLVVVLQVVQWGSLFEKPWFIWPMVGLLILMGFGLFGAFTFRLPVAAYSFEPRHDTFSGNFLLGMLTAVLATPCTAPLLPPLLVWTASQPTYIGVPAMLMVGVGMASPYLILSALPELARKFPRTGPWSELFKQMMGFMMLAAAAFFGAGRLLGNSNFWYVVDAVIAVAALFMVARATQLSKMARPIAITSVLAILMIGGSLWWTFQVTGVSTPHDMTNLGTFETYSPERFNALRAQHKIVLVKFTANWCATCQVIEGSVFQDPTVWKDLRDNNVVAMKVDFSEDNPQGQKFLKTLNPGGGIPLTAVYPPG